MMYRSLILLLAVVSAHAQACPSGREWPGAQGDVESGFSHATYYTTPNSGACGYGSNIPANIAAVSDALWTANGDGAVCGSCYEIACCGSDYLTNACTGGPVVVQVTDECPAAGNPICVNQPHFDLGTAAFSAIGSPVAGVLKVQYTRVACPASSTITVLVKGSSPYYIQMVFSGLNEGISQAQVSPSQGNAAGEWLSMPHAWGAAYQWAAGTSGKQLQGDISIELTSSTGKVIVLKNCLLAGQWDAGSEESCSPNF